MLSYLFDIEFLQDGIFIFSLQCKSTQAPENVIDYIILHELCHLKIKEHTHHFWDLLHKFMPDYQVQIEWLKINGSRLV